MRIFFSFFIFFVLFSQLSCSKITIENSLNKEQEISQLPKNNINSKVSHRLNEIQRLSLEAFFKTYDTAVLNRLRYIEITPMGSTYTNLAINQDLQYMYSKNIELISLLNSINPIAYNSLNMSPEDEIVVLAGVFELYKEQESINNSNIRAAFPWRCIIAVIEGIVTGKEVIAAYKSLIASGAEWVTIRSFIIQCLKRYGGWALAAVVVYDITKECL